MQNDAHQGAVYLQTNDEKKNEVVAYERAANGSLTYVGAYESGGRGTGKPHLPSQGSLVLSDDGRWLLAANAGSDERPFSAAQKLLKRVGLHLPGVFPNSFLCCRNRLYRLTKLKI